MAGRPPNPGGRVDLHAHTVYSDGVLTPQELVDLAIEKHLSAIAITDHDSVEGIDHARAAAAGRLEVVPGIEVSTSMDGLDLHVLGYFLDYGHPGLQSRLATFRQERRDRVSAIVGRLAELGAPVQLDSIFAAAGPGVVGRPHVAAALMEAGHVSTMDDAFRQFLGARARAFVPRPAFHPREAIEMIESAGGLSVLAHPGAHVSDRVVEELRDAGLSGIEIWHPQHGSALVRRYRQIAARLGLIETGGSDFHGPHRSTQLGDMRVPVTVLRRLKEAAGVPG